MYDMFIGMIKEDTISTVIEELAYNLELSFSLLSNAKPNLRQLSATIILSVTRSIVSSSCPDSYKPLKITLSKLLQDAFDECLDKKNSRISLKFFEDCLERSTEFTTRALLSRLVRGTIDGKTPYLRSECCKIVSVILKKKESQFEDKDFRANLTKPSLKMVHEYISRVHPTVTNKTKKKIVEFFKRVKEQEQIPLFVKRHTEYFQDKKSIYLWFGFGLLRKLYRS